VVDALAISIVNAHDVPYLGALLISELAHRLITRPEDGCFLATTPGRSAMSVDVIAE
jgi:hypothetical protein